MAKEFDIYLRKHLTECDLLVYSIPYRDGISVTNRLILEAALESYILQKFAAVQMKSVLATHIDEMIKLCYEKLNSKTILGVSAKFEAHNNIYVENDPIIIDSPSITALERIMNEVKDDIAMTVNAQVLETKIAASAGLVDFPMLVDASVTDTFKRSLLSMPSSINIDAAVTQTNKHSFIGADTLTVIDSSLQSLCYQLTFTASSAIEIVTRVLGTEIRHSLGRWYDGIAIGAKVWMTDAQKFITAEAIVNILQEATGKLIKVLYPEESVMSIKVDDLNASMKRYRLLYEVDGETNENALSDYDDMTLGDLDYVILQE